ncbi:hypothetical protein [Listeria grandensis]|uniref:hypothetical protein n=1 Tax=Listeria grandensis TaxID=1494963 RepID=UPI00164DEDEC|nr:hypothetical protein [Listeria grandensis]MBC6316519.1 hypothetical protein [Listeria grandensis]
MKNKQKTNNAYLLRKWIFRIISWCFGLAIVTFLFSLNTFIGYMLGGLIIIPYIQAGITIIYRKRKHKSTWQYQSAEDVIKESNRKMPKIEDEQYARVASVYQDSLVYLFYGERQKVSAVLETIDWSICDSYQQSLKYIIITLDNYLYEAGNFEGLVAAEKAKELATSMDSPLDERAIRTLDTNIMIGKILTEGSSREYVVALERLYYESKPMYNPNIIAEWALAIAYKQIGEDTKSAKMLARCKASAPYGVMLHKVS